MELKDIENLPSAQVVADLEVQSSELQSVLDSPDILPEVREAFELAIRDLEDRKRSNAAFEPLQNAYATYGVEGMQGLNHLAILEGRLTPEELDPRKASLKARIMTARDFFDKYGVHTPEAESFLENLSPSLLAVLDSTEIVEVSEEPTEDEEPVATPEAANKHKSIEITIGLNVVSIGKDGKKTAYSSTHISGHRDYTVPRRKALAKLASLLPGEKIPARDLFAESFGDDEEFTTNKMLEVRRWLVGLTYRREQIIHYTSRGIYYINPNFDLTLNFGEKFSQIQDEDIELGPAAEQRQSDPEMVDGLYIMSNRLSRFNFVLEEANAPTVPQEAIDGLSDTESINLTHLKGDSAAVQEYRLTVVSKLIELLNDEKRFFEYIDNADVNSPEYKFIEYIAGLDEEQLKLAIRLINANMKTTDVIRGRVVPIPTQVFDANGLIYPFPEVESKNGNGMIQGSSQGELELDFDTDVDDEVQAAEVQHIIPEIGEDTLQVGELQVIADALESEAETILPLVEARIVESTAENGKSWSEREQQLFGQLEQKTAEVAGQFLARFKPDEKPQMNKLASVIPGLSIHAVNQARDNRIIARIKRGSVGKSYSIEDVVKAVAYRDKELQNLFKGQKYKKHTEELVSSTIAKAIRASEAKKS